jgi:hypothetical protein
MPCSGSECKPQVTGFGAMIYYDYDCVSTINQQEKINTNRPMTLHTAKQATT